MKFSVSPTQERDACLALLLLLLLIWLFYRANYIIYICMGVIICAMIWPACMRPFAVLWFGLARALGAVMSRLLLALIWALMVVPVGLFRKLLGKDSMGLKKWHGAANSCFIARNHTYEPQDLKKPY